ncbi:MAG TPA: O-methyltransferase [Silvibacterium sp.]|nr:O-methyltransferase [Silvibacterium sp.]
MSSEVVPEKLQDLWSEVDQYVNDKLVPQDPAFESAVRTSAEAGLPEIAVTASQGKLLHLLARSIGARNILEVGTLGGYSTIWMGRALPHDGRLVTLEYSAKHAEVARKNIEHAGLSGIVELREGAALDTLPNLAAERRAAFDFIFIDADKENNAAYFEWALKLSRAGGLIFIDNVVWHGEVADSASKELKILGIRRLNELLAKETRVIATTIQTVGSKGYDGFTLALVLG